MESHSPLTMLGITDPAAISLPAPGTVAQFATGLGLSRVRLATLTTEGVLLPAQTAMHALHIAIAKAAPSATALTMQGFSAGTVLGTGTSRVVTAASNLAATPRVGYVSSGTAGSLAGWRSNTPQFSIPPPGSTRGSFFISAKLAFPVLSANSRAFFGVAPVAAPTNVNPDTVTNCWGIGKNATSPNLQIIGRGSAPYALDLDVEYSIATLSSSLLDFQLTCDYLSSTPMLSYSVKRVGSSTPLFTGTQSGAVIPASGVMLQLTGWVCNNTTATSNAIDISSIYSEVYP